MENASDLYLLNHVYSNCLGNKNPFPKKNYNHVREKLYFGSPRLEPVYT